LEIIIIFEGTLVGGVEKSVPKYEKQKADNKMAAAMTTGLKTRTPNSNPKATGTKEITIPNMNEARTSPSRIAGMETGADISLSRVLMLPSQGRITGETAVAVKNSVMLSKPEIMTSRGIDLPTEKARNKNMGNRMPKTRTGPFR
jgi:hypothetical protein